ncbi:MAG: signal recognition particle-docking protein FtsY [Saprospiraceae bacterium]
MGFFDKFFSKEKKQDLDKGLEKTKENFFSKIAKAVAGKTKIDEEVLDNLEEALIAADVGLDTTLRIIDRINTRVSRDKYFGSDELQDLLRDEIVQMLAENNTEDIEDFNIPSDKRPYVLLVIGVNGVGKTTTIGKLAHQFRKKGLKVTLGAADTFRAAAVDQLKIWADRTGSEFFSKGMNADPAAVTYEAINHALHTQCDVAIIDTAGRLHNKTHLMQELGKIHRSADKRLPGAPHDVLLVLDASTGQNAFEQAKQFTEVAPITALALTKLDGTAKGGVAIGISDQFKIPIRYIGVGEGIDMLQVFNKKAFVESLFE